MEVKRNCAHFCPACAEAPVLREAARWRRRASSFSAAPISPVQGGLLFHGGEEGDAEMAVKGQIDDDIPGCVDVADLSADVLAHQSSGDQDVPALVGQTLNAFRDGFTDCGSPVLPRSSTATGE